MAQTAWLRVAVLAIFMNAHQYFLRLLDKVVPEAYLDEVFHIPQAQRFWQGKWTQWDPKITTPPGVYLWSYLFNSVRGGRGDVVSVEDLRFSNSVLLYLLVLVLTIWTTLAHRNSDISAVLQQEFVIVSFPLLIFFSGLYYTDLFSALTVVLAYSAWEAGARYQRRRWIYQVLHLVFGLLSLVARQTNVFWVAVFLAGLQVVRTVKSRAVVALHDPGIAQTSFGDYFFFIQSLLRNIFDLKNIPYIILDLWPHLVLLLSFTSFVIWNEGVVLGDKQNHVATLYTPQMLYLWPLIVFFSWPTILSSLATQLQPFNFTTLRARLPRFRIVSLLWIISILSVHYTPVIHPFLLADNRHYMFYVLRRIMRPIWLRYIVVPIYIICAWLVVNSLGHAIPPVDNTPKPASLSTPKSTKPKPKPKPNSNAVAKSDTSSTVHTDQDTVHLSFVFIWTTATTLSLVTTSLVEPRYFIIPWLIWRMNVPAYTPDTSDTRVTSRSRNANTSIVSRLQHLLVPYSLWLELTWYIAINVVTIYIFLHCGYEWPQEPGKIQRFMW